MFKINQVRSVALNHGQANQLFFCMLEISHTALNGLWVLDMTSALVKIMIKLNEKQSGKVILFVIILMFACLASIFFIFLW